MSHRIAALIPVRAMVRTALASVAAFAAVTVAPSASATAADTPARDPLTLARQRLDFVRGEATVLSAQISDMQSEQARLVAQIADAERRIPALRARAVELRNEVKHRAAALYVRQGSSAALVSAIDAENAEDAVRAAHLTNTIGDHELELAVEARRTAVALAAQENDLRARHADLDRTLAGLAPLNALLQQKLASATKAYDTVRLLLADATARHGADVTTLASVCPVQGVAVFTDDFGEPRPGGPHPGIDMGAVTGTPVVAVVAGIMRHDDTGGDGGNGAWLLGTDQVGYYYAHFSRYEGDDRIVAAGDVIGYVGQTGNATGPHLHFEVHPGLAPPVDPYATLVTLCTDDAPAPGR